MNHTISHPALPKTRTGTVTIEFALMVPVALLLTFGLIEFARVNMIRNTAQNAAYEGARAAIVPGGSAAKAEVAANSVLAVLGVRNASVQISPLTITNRTPQVTVSISIPLADNMWIMPAFVTNKTMLKTCSLTRESTQSGY